MIEIIRKKNNWHRCCDAGSISNSYISTYFTYTTSFEFFCSRSGRSLAARGEAQPHSVQRCQFWSSATKQLYTVTRVFEKCFILNINSFLLWVLLEVLEWQMSSFNGPLPKTGYTVFPFIHQDIHSDEKNYKLCEFFNIRLVPKRSWTTDFSRRSLSLMRKLPRLGSIGNLAHSSTLAITNECEHTCECACFHEVHDFQLQWRS